jgi:hypothetical protein
MGIDNRILEVPFMHTAVIALALTVLSGQDPVQSGPIWFKIVDGNKFVREIRPQELRGLVEEIGRIKSMVDNPRLMGQFFKPGTNLLIPLQDRIEELLYSDLPLGRFERVGIAP